MGILDIVEITSNVWLFESFFIALLVPCSMILASDVLVQSQRIFCISGSRKSIQIPGAICIKYVVHFLHIHGVGACMRLTNISSLKTFVRL